jgi:hypothetical protein
MGFFVAPSVDGLLDNSFLLPVVPVLLPPLDDDPITSTTSSSSFSCDSTSSKYCPFVYPFFLHPKPPLTL